MMMMMSQTKQHKWQSFGKASDYC